MCTYLKEQLENERRSLSMLYEQYLAERDFRRKQLFMQMRVDVEKEEDEQKRIAAECLRRYAELLAPRSNRSPQRRSVSGAERFGRFKAIFGRKKNAERTSSPKKIVDQSAINKKGSSTSDSTSLNPTSSSSHSIVKARYEEECVVCMDRPVKLLISPCGHVCICEQCSLSVEECPLCRTTTHLPAPVRKWTTTAIGLGAIPFIVKPIDTAVELGMDMSIRKCYPKIALKHDQHSCVKFSTTHLPAPVRKWTTTAIGLGAIPFIVKPIDTAVELGMDMSIRKCYPKIALKNDQIER
ncbi:Mitochondrial fission process protein 1 [Toxocara canis]|uniref:Mitochondrial fission process protein 1 n=1 Tax=Toxocara canis TaxID=6265 RepID=A0A0B2VPX0_TOXCA|nr:Mitochondrial fission process protein 1 [Toxocara canis]